MSEYNIQHENVVDCSGQPLTPALLELLIAKINEHGQVLILNVGRSSSMEIAMDLLAMAKNPRRSISDTTVPYSEVPTEPIPYTASTPLPTYVPDQDE